MIYAQNFFENSLDICSSVRDGLEGSSYPEHYVVSSKENGRYMCHFVKNHMLLWHH